MNRKGDDLKHWMDKQETFVAPAEWSEPECYDLNDYGNRREMYSRIVMGDAKIQRKLSDFAEDLFEMEHPDQKSDTAAKERYLTPILREGDRYGKWHYFPWLNRIVQYPDQEEHRQLLTFRNRELISKDELRRLGLATTAHIGLSVGSHILTETTHMGLANKVILADSDVMSVPNLNRIHAGMPEVGMRKTDVAGIRLSELNPYVKQIHLPEGVNPSNVHRIFEQNRPDLIFEEVDHMPTKILLRKFAKQARIALLMATDTGDRSMIDVERYDEDDITEAFLGKLSRDELAMLEKGNLTSEQNLHLIVKLIGLENIDPRFAQSMGHIGITLGGIAQLGTTASSGAAYAAVAGREILLDRGPRTGRYKMSPQEIMKLRYPSVVQL